MDDNDRLPSPEEFALLVAEFATEVARMFEWMKGPFQHSGFEDARRKIVEAYEEAHRRATSDPHRA
ncbi:MAG TPA: hypothetical protein VN602_10680 [Gemmatimonadaceae bacterium]|nr:hypothetical protein [Gemmatimonadaceae bacterium]